MTYRADPARGCGYKHPGGFYLEADLSEGGALSPMSWVLGEQYERGVNLFTNVPPRAMMLFNPAATFATDEIVLDTHYIPEDKRELFDRYAGNFGCIGLLDYVGERYYTPWSFAKELFEFGPSRKISKGFLNNIASLLPLPVFFAHKNIPMFRTRAKAMTALSLSTIVNETIFLTTPTWYLNDWGLKVRDNLGGDHYMVQILKGHHNNEALFEDNELINDYVDYFQVLFCASWFTRGTYVMLGDDDPGVDIENVTNLPRVLLNPDNPNK